MASISYLKFSPGQLELALANIILHPPSISDCETLVEVTGQSLDDVNRRLTDMSQILRKLGFLEPFHVLHRVLTPLDRH